MTMMYLFSIPFKQ